MASNEDNSGGPWDTGSVHSDSLRADDVASIISSLGGQQQVPLLSKASLLGFHNRTSYSAFEEAVLSEGSDALRDALSSISASSAAAPPPLNNLSRFSTNLFGQGSGASGAAGVHSAKLGHPFGGSSFLEKFASVTEKTRDLELGNTAKPTAIGSRRGSNIGSDIASPQQTFREPRKQSFSEKLDSYISATGSPTQSRHLSFNSGTEKPLLDDAKNIWHPGSASTFYPTTAPDPVPNPAAPAPNGYPFGEMSFLQPDSIRMPMNQMMMASPFIPNGYVHPIFPPYMNPNDVREQDDENEDTEEEVEAQDSGSEGKEESLDQRTTFREGKNPNAEANPMSPFMIPPFHPYGQPFPIVSPISPIGTPPPMMMQNQMMGMVSGAKGKQGNRPRSPLGAKPYKSQGVAAQPPSSASGKRNKSPRFKGKQQIIRSPLLEEFRATKTTGDYDLEKITSHAYEFAKDQHGSRFIQQELGVAPEEAKELFFREIVNNSMDLMTDVFGNYVIQKYFEFGSASQKNELFEIMKGSFNVLSVQMYGCRVVQRCIEGIPLENQLVLIEELRPNIFNLVKDQNGNHVIQKAIEQIPIENIPFVLESLKHQIYHLSMHPYGCRVIQRLLECSSIDDQSFILEELKSYIYYLVQDQFGNYVIQHVIESGNTEYQDKILKVILENLIELSKHKFASNAVEKCIINLSNKSRAKIYDEMLKQGEENDETNLMKMMKDPFANYVVQRMVELIDVERKKVLVLKIKEYLDVIRKSQQGKHLASIEKLNLICSRYE